MSAINANIISNVPPSIKLDSNSTARSYLTLVRRLTIPYNPCQNLKLVSFLMHFARTSFLLTKAIGAFPWQNIKSLWPFFELVFPFKTNQRPPLWDQIPSLRTSIYLARSSGEESVRPRGINSDTATIDHNYEMCCDSERICNFSQAPNNARR